MHSFCSLCADLPIMGCNTYPFKPLLYLTQLSTQENPHDPKSGSPVPVPEMCPAVTHPTAARQRKRDLAWAPNMPYPTAPSPSLAGQSWQALLSEQLRKWQKKCPLWTLLHLGTTHLWPEPPSHKEEPESLLVVPLLTPVHRLGLLSVSVPAHCPGCGVADQHEACVCHGICSQQAASPGSPCLGKTRVRDQPSTQFPHGSSPAHHYTSDHANRVESWV